MANREIHNWDDHAKDGSPNYGRRTDFLHMLGQMVELSYDMHGCPRWGRHEALGIIQEEFEEFKLEIYEDGSWEDVQKELMHLACVVIRYLETELSFNQDEFDNYLRRKFKELREETP